MQKTYHFCILTCFFLSFVLSTNALFEGLEFFQQKCNRLPEFPDNYQNSCVPINSFVEACRAHAAVVKYQLNTASWVTNKPEISQLCDHTRKDPICIPFVQRLVVPHGTTIALFGDLHGSMHGLVRSLSLLKERGYIDDTGQILNKDLRIFFLGDFVDNGKYGVEVTYILMNLKIANPDQVFLVRGNHEDVNMSAQYGFLNELEHKLGSSFVSHCSWYDMLPAAIYLGSEKSPTMYEYALCCHGGLEPGFNAKTLLNFPHKQKMACQVIPDLQQVTLINKLGDDTIKNQAIRLLHLKDDLKPDTQELGFLWADFFVSDREEYNETTICGYDAARGIILGKPLTAAILEQNSSETSKLCRIFRAHQHHSCMLDRLHANKGIASLWEGLVYTFLSAPSIWKKNKKTIDPSDCGFGVLTTTPDSIKKWPLIHSSQLPQSGVLEQCGTQARALTEESKEPEEEPLQTITNNKPLEQREKQQQNQPLTHMDTVIATPTQSNKIALFCTATVLVIAAAVAIKTWSCFSDKRKQ